MVDYSILSQLPDDPILSMTTRYNASTNPKKVNLGVGAYRDENGSPMVLPAVREAESRIYNAKLNHEYAPMQGLTSFRSLSQKLIFGSSSNNIATVATISGSGALFIGFSFLYKAFGKITMHLPTPVWGNTGAILKHAMPENDIKEYQYLVPGTPNLNIASMVDYFNALEPNSWVLMHPVAHNPSGVDPTKDQWNTLVEIFINKKLNVFFDCAYQGFASGDLDNDAYAIRLFKDKGVNMIVSQSYAKNLGLYGERTGALHVVCKDNDECETVLSWLKIIVRRTYSSGPLFGCRIVEEVLGDESLFNSWNDGDLKVMSARIRSMRQRLRGELERINCPPPPNCVDWSHITSQIGMFSYTMIPADKCVKLVEEYDVYLLKNGRISISGLNEHNVEYVAECIKKVLI